MTDDLQVKVAVFRVKELQSCLEKLGLAKTGRKPELQQRILTYINQGPAGSRDHWKGEAAGRIINQVHCEMRGIPYRHPSSSPSSSTHVAVATEHIGASAGRSEASPSPASANTTIRCPCGANRDTGSRMIQCGVADCGVWQHCHCVGIPPGTDMPASFMCELCRLDRCDPFWFPTSKALIAPTLLRHVPSRPPVTLLGPREACQRVDKTLELSSATARLIQQQPHKYRIQMVCVMMNDPVACRMHWPLHPNLQVNYTGFKPYPRNASNKMGPAGRDEPVNLAGVCFSPPSNRSVISLEAQDPRKFCITVQMAERRSMDEVQAMMAPTESLPESLLRVRQQAAKDTSAADGEDDDIAVESTGFSLKCPLSGSRMQTPARVVSTDGLVAFDLMTFLEIAKRTRKWVCPHTMKNFSIYELQVDAYMQRVLDCLQSQPDIVEIEVSAEGQWRPAGSTERWRDITEDLSTAAITAPVVKQELKNDAQASDSDSEEEMSEGEELRQAAAAMAVSKKRRAEEQIISLLSDSDDEPMPVSPPASHAAARPSQQPSRGNVRPSAPLPAAGLRAGIPPPMPHIMPNPRWLPRPSHATSAASPSLSRGTGVFSSGSQSSGQPGSSIAAAKAGIQSSAPPPTHASRSGGAAPGVGSLSSHFVRPGQGTAAQQPAIPGLGPQSPQAPPGTRPGDWRKTLPAMFQRQQLQQQQQQQQQTAQPAGSAGTRPHPGASHGSASGARSGAVAPGSSQGARPTASSSRQGGASASQPHSCGAAQPPRLETTATTTRITQCPDNPLRLRIQKFPKPTAPASAPPTQPPPGSSAAGPGPQSPLRSTGTPTHSTHPNGYPFPGGTHHASPPQPTALGPPPTHYGTPWMDVQCPVPQPQLQHMQNLQYMPAMPPYGVAGFQQAYHPGMYGSSQPPQMQQQQPHMMSGSGGWPSWTGQPFMPSGMQPVAQSAGYQSSMVQQQQPQAHGQQSQAHMQHNSQPASQPPSMDELTAMLLAEDTPMEPLPSNAPVTLQPSQHVGSSSQVQGSQPLPSSDDELMRLLQQQEALETSNPAGSQLGAPASDAARSGSQALPEQATHAGPHPRHSASGNSAHSGLQGSAGGPATAPPASGSQQQAGASGQQVDANGLDPDWTPPGIEGDWEPSSAPSSSFGDFLNNCSFDFMPGNLDEAGDGAPGLSTGGNMQTTQQASNEPQLPDSPPPAPPATGVIDLDTP